MIRHHSAILILFTLPISGCAKQAVVQATGTSPAPVALSASGRSSKLANTDNGLELHRWTVMDQPGRIITALSKHADGQAADDQTLARLQRNGFRLVRIAVDDLDQALADMGGATVNANEWHGQA